MHIVAIHWNTSLPSFFSCRVNRFSCQGNMSAEEEEEIREKKKREVRTNGSNLVGKEEEGGNPSPAVDSIWWIQGGKNKNKGTDSFSPHKNSWKWRQKRSFLMSNINETHCRHIACREKDEKCPHFPFAPLLCDGQSSMSSTGGESTRFLFLLLLLLFRHVRNKQIRDYDGGNHEEKVASEIRKSLG